MAAATADENLVTQVRGNGATRTYPVYQSTTLYAGTLIGRNSSGYAIAATDTAGVEFVGFAKEYVNNASGASGAVDVTVDPESDFKILTSGAAITDVGRPVAVEYDNQVDINQGNVWVGRILKYVSATSVWVRPGKVNMKYLDIPLLLASVTDGDVKAFTASENMLITKLEWHQNVAVTTGSKASTLNLEIGTTNLTGGVISLTSAACVAHAVLTPGSGVTAITGNNWAPQGSAITLEASSTTAFAEGSGFVRIWYVN